MSTVYELWKTIYLRHLENLYEIITVNNKNFPEFSEFSIWIFRQRKYSLNDLFLENEASETSY